MTSPSTTLTYSQPDAGSLDGPPEPGVVVVFYASRPFFHAQPLKSGSLVVMRGPLRDSSAGTLCLDDERVSRKHLSIERRGESWVVTDCGSRNGTWVDAIALEGTREVLGARVVRAGDCLLLLVANVRPYLRQSVEVKGELVLGPGLQRAWQAIGQIAQASDTLHLVGESGTGKELAARHFHDSAAGPRRPFVAVNCAGIPEGIAERLLFGARKGAYSGADQDSEGYLQAASGGTLFLDEVGELESQVQAKLLRALETRVVLPLGATHGTAAQFRLCSATHRDLRDDVGSGGFRGDLYFRLGRPSVTLPPLRERQEEIPWLLARVVRELNVSLVEACLLRHWPGNVRELLLEARAAVAASGGERVGSRHLAADAGTAFEGTTTSQARPSDEQIREVIERHQGNVSAAARALNMHRTQLRRWVARHPPSPR